MRLSVIVFFSTINILTAFVSFAAGPKVLGTPRQYFYAPDGNILKESKDVEDKIFWIVFSDRGDNVTFETAGAKKVKKVMQFLEKFYVTDETGDYLHLFKYADNVLETGNSRRLNKNAIDYGWALKKNLLLWVRCIVNEKRVPIRALPIITLPFMQENLMPYLNFEESKVVLYKKPSLPVDSATSTSEMYQFLYVYKDDGNSVLLAKKSLSSVFTIDADIVGWTSKKVLQIWGGREFVEPCWESTAYEERKKKDIVCSVFSNKEEALYWQRSGIGLAPMWNDDPKDKPWTADTKRFPILEQDSSIYKVGLIVGFAYARANKAQEKKASKSGALTANSSFSILLPAYVALSTDNLKAAPFRKVLFLSSEELAEVNIEMKKLLIESSGPTMRAAFAEAIKSVLSDYVGSIKADEMIKKGKLSPADVIYYITGIACKNNVLYSCIITDITNADKVKESDIIAIQKYLQMKYQGLSTVVVQPGLALPLSWNTFYWVPEELMP